MSSTDVSLSGNLGVGASVSPIRVLDVGPVDLKPVEVAKVGPVGPVTVSLPDPIHIDLDKIATIHIAVDSLPKISLGLDPIEIRLTQFPSIRGHLPADFSVGLSMLGMEMLCIRLCGEAQIITEPYTPNPCEVCGEPPDVTRQQATHA